MLDVVGNPIDWFSHVVAHFNVGTFQVHQNPSHMLAEAQSIYKLLQIVKIFTPRVSR